MFFEESRNGAQYLEFLHGKLALYLAVNVLPRLETRNYLVT